MHLAIRKLIDYKYLELMIKTLGFILTILGIIGLVLGVIGLFGANLVYMNSWALAILGLIFFFAGIGLLKRRPDTDEVPPQSTRGDARRY